MRTAIVAVGLCTLWLLVSGTARAELRVRDICRVKGQEENVLIGMGLVVGLKGTGEGDTPTKRSLARMMELMNGAPIGRTTRGLENFEELNTAKNVTSVFVTVTVPSEGAREGSMINCTVNSIGAKSLEGGYLMLTPLRGPNPNSTRIYGFAKGPLAIETSGPPTSARIHQGCRMETDITNEFVHNGRLTLVLDQNHASFQTAQDIEDLLNTERDFIENEDRANVAKAKDQLNIEIGVPKKYLDNPVQFASFVMNLRLAPPQTDARVVIRERDGVIVIGDDVEIGPVAVTHKNLTIQTGGQTQVNQFVPIDTSADTSTTKLQALVNALNAVKVPTDDIIDIIKGLERSGDLFGHVIIE